MGNCKNCDLMIINDYVKCEDDVNGLNDWGECGDFLRMALAEVGFDISKVNYTFIVRTLEVMESYGRAVVKEPSAKKISEDKLRVLAEIQVYKPKVVLLLGAISLKAILKEDGIVSKRGRIFEVDGISYIPTFKAEMVVKNDSFLENFMQDIELAFKTFTGEQEVILPVNYKLITTKKELSEFAQYAADQEEVAVDLETSALSPFSELAQIMCIIFSFIETETFIIPWYAKEQIFKGSEMNLVKLICKSVLESEIPKIFHGGKFDIGWCEVKEQIMVQNIVGDTMYEYYLLNEQTGCHGLDYLCWRFVPSMGGYWDKLDLYKSQHKDCDPSRGGNYSNIPWSVMTYYAGADGDVTLRCHHKILPLLKNL